MFDSLLIRTYHLFFLLGAREFYGSVSGRSIADGYGGTFCCCGLVFGSGSVFLLKARVFCDSRFCCSSLLGAGAVFYACYRSGCFWFGDTQPIDSKDKLNLRL